jgi:cytidylate kinase
MSDWSLVPSIEHRLAAAIEINRRRHERGDPFRKPGPVVTISREYGCEAFPVAERLKALLEEKTQSAWLLMDKALLERLAKEHQLQAGAFDRIGNRSRFFDDLVSVLSPNWQSDKDYYRILAWQITDLAEHGNIIFVGRGTPPLLQERENTYHFRIVAPLEFRARSISRRLDWPEDKAMDFVRVRQEQRLSFLKDFLNTDIGDPYLYHLLFNNAKNAVERIASTICGYVPVA